MELPAWCRIRRGSSPLVLVAPHGGRRASDDLCLPNGRRLKINDLHTAELAAELAERLDASMLGNCALDRNELDLNRISAVERAAPYFLAELAGLVAGALARHPVVEILVIHGWHVGQAKCDVGIGASLASEADAESAAAHLTVSPDYVRRRLGAFRARLASRGAEVVYGERFPASHRENLLQLFRPGNASRLSPELGRAAADGRIQAVQLELGIPLRWPGPHREAFVDAVADVFGRGLEAEPPPAPAPAAGDDGNAIGVRVHDPASDVAVIAGMSPNGDGARGGRLLVLHGRNRVILFTGEERRAAGTRVGALVFEPRDDGFAVRFEGPAVEVDDGELYLRTEAALERARLVDVRVDLAFAPRAASFGGVTGTIELEGRRLAVDAPGFADSSFARGVARGERRRLALAAAFGGDLAITARAGDGASRAERIDRAGSRAIGAEIEELAANGGLERVALRLEGGERLLAEPECRMAILRPFGMNDFARISFGVARFALDGGRTGTGFFEYSERYEPREPSR